MNMTKLNFVGPMLFVKFTILAVTVFSLTLAKPAASAAHLGAQKICSLVMTADECAKHC
ncbi:hypothetical protein KI809_02035 [Geobacter pelophilus]|uniref:Uncharacterized protein n=1 Tax=Geoanaerobacter pelophilus TaxID=60036 RepID=A0AAW4L5H2_9BACT|nr:hypothetical protein [Geoanaerobacter pelophilus]MBT0663067.1 hypothetical protein [Geoanaerobacter pelophilus]